MATETLEGIADFGEATVILKGKTVILKGKETKVAYFLMSLPYSDAFLILTGPRMPALCPAPAAGRRRPTGSLRELLLSALGRSPLGSSPWALNRD